MVIAAFVILLILCIGLGVLQALSKVNNSWQSILFRTLAPLSCLIFALTNTNLASAYGAFTLMTSIGLAFLIVYECFACTIENKNAKLYTLSLTNFAGFILFAFAVLSLTSFSIYSILAGILFGIASAFIAKMVKRSFSWPTVLMLMLNLAASFMYLMQSVALVASGKNIAVALLCIFSSALLVCHTFMGIFKKEGKVFHTISNLLRILSVILISAAIYFI